METGQHPPRPKERSMKRERKKLPKTGTSFPLLSPVRTPWTDQRSGAYRADWRLWCR